MPSSSVTVAKNLRERIEVRPLHRRTDGPWTASFKTDNGEVQLPVSASTSSGAYRAAIKHLRR
jgi:hypothetical protein